MYAVLSPPSLWKATGEGDLVISRVKMLFDPIERARIKKHIGLILFALLIIVFARSIVDYITGGVLSPPPGLEGLASAIDSR